MPPTSQETPQAAGAVRPPGTVLALDASGDPASVGVAASGRLLGTLEAAAGQRAGQAVHGLVREAVERWLGGAPPALIAAVRGPGSFTGLRVGLAAASGLALAWGREAVGVEATACLARASGLTGRLLCLAGGGQGRVFVALHALNAETAALTTLREVCDASPNEAALLITQLAPDRVVFRGDLGPAGVILRAAAESALGRPTLQVDGPLAGAAALLALAGVATGLQPLYAQEPIIRPPRP